MPRIGPTVIPLPLRDNYLYVVRDDHEACVVDPTSAAPVEKLVNRHGLKLRFILTTHGHFDHTGGNDSLSRTFGCPALGAGDTIPGRGRVVADGERIPFGSSRFVVLATPGHTGDSLCYYLPGTPGVVFTGDTLFIGGCGRLLGGSASELWESMNRLKQLPDDTLVYPGHEYTSENYDFLLSEDRDNPVLIDRAEELRQRLRTEGTTVPSTIGLEKETNLFMRAASPDEFAALRRRKDRW